MPKLPGLDFKTILLVLTTLAGYSIAGVVAYGQYKGAEAKVNAATISIQEKVQKHEVEIQNLRIVQEETMKALASLQTSSSTTAVEVANVRRLLEQMLLSDRKEPR